jgi:hypothetical protein
MSDLLRHLRPSPCASPSGRGNAVAKAAGSVSHEERAGVRGGNFAIGSLAVLMAFAASKAIAEDLVPHPPKGGGEHCVADTDFMRRNHMAMMKHQRDETVHEGVRGKVFSIAACVNCHAVKGADGVPVSYENPAHFCRGCHDYAAVSIDCFECHSSRPATPKTAAVQGEETAALAAYLKERQQ